MNESWPSPGLMTGESGMVLAVVRDDAALADEAADEAIAAIGARVAVKGEWNANAERIAAHGGRLIVVVDGHGVAEAALRERVDAVVRLCGERHWPLLIAIGREQIDVVEQFVADPQVSLLCEATTSDWLAALAMADTFDRSELLGDRWRESEAARLARLNEEVARIAEVLARLSGSAASGQGERFDDRHVRYAPAPTGFELTSAQVRDSIRARRLRDRFLGQRLFEDPAWDMMLDLLAAHLERGQVSVSSLCIASAVAPTTALRWIAKLTEHGLLVREADPFDRRRAYIALSPAALDALARYAAALKEQGLPLP